MTDNQKKALELYLESATIYNDFEPLSDRALSSKLLELGVIASKSTIARWRVEHCFADSLKMHIDAALSNNEQIKNMVIKSSNGAIAEKTIVDFARNQELLSKSYEIVETFANQVLDKIDKNLPVSKDEVDTALKILNITAGREDKMLDRKTLLDAAERISKDDILNRLSAPLAVDRNNDAIDVDIEE